MIPSGNNYVVLRMDGASISQQCLLTAGSTISFYLRLRPGFKSTGCTITFEVTISYSRVLTIQLPSSATAWTLYSVIVPGSYGNSQSLQFEVTVPDGSDASAEIDNVVIAPPSSVSVTSLSYRHSFNGGTASDSVMFPSASRGGWTGTIGPSAAISSGQLQLPGGVGSYLQLPVGVLGSPAPAAVSIEIWVTIASSQNKTGDPVIFQLGSHISGSAGSLMLTWESSSSIGKLKYISADKSVSMLTYFYSYRDPTSIHIVIVLVNGGWYTSGIYINGDIYNQFTISNTMLLSFGSAGEINLIGAGTDPSQPALIGSVDEFRVWSGALSRQDIIKHYAMGSDLFLGTRNILP